MEKVFKELKQLFVFKPIKIKKMKLDLELTLLLLILMGIGIIFIYSSSSVEGIKTYGDANFFIKRHIVFILIGFIGLLLASMIELKTIVSYLPHLNVLTISLMMLTYFPQFAVTVNGATRWIELFGFQFQPSEFGKVTFILTMAFLVSYKIEKKEINSFSKGIFPILLYAMLYFSIILSQKHMSAAGVFVFLSFVILFAGGIYLRYVLFAGILSIFAAIYAVFIEQFRLVRIFSFLNPEADPLGAGYHILQSFYALGSGKWFGVGVGMSKQKFGWLPEPYNDFIVAIIGEETGFLGVSFLIIVSVLFLFKVLIISVSAKDNYSFLVSIGIFALFFFQIIINLMVVSGLFPVTGMIYPFVSYGGTGLITSMFLVGILMNLSNDNDTKETESN